jgi:hypothetical protein
MSNKFDYKYTALSQEERKEIDSIRRQYTPQEHNETKLERLRRLNSQVKNTAVIWGLILGVVGCLIFGFGLTLILEWKIFVWGIALMVVGSIPMLIAYPVHNTVMKRNKSRYGEEIIRLSEELLNEK